MLALSCSIKISSSWLMKRKILGRKRGMRLTEQAVSLSLIHRRAVCLEEMTCATEEEMIFLSPCEILPGTNTTVISFFFFFSPHAAHPHTRRHALMPPPFILPLPSSSQLSIHRSSVTAGVQPIHHRSGLGEPLGHGRVRS